MKRVIVVVVLISSIILLFGQYHYNNKIQAQTENAVMIQKEEQKIEEQKEKERIAMLENNKYNSVIDWLKYKSIEKNNLVVTVFGSSVTAGAGASEPSKTWSGLLDSYLYDFDDISSVSIVNMGHGGYSTQDLLNENKIDELITSNPDLVIIEPTVINNYNKNVSIDQTNEDVSLFISTIREKLPETMVVIQSSNPTEFVGENDLGYSYEDYIEVTKTIAEENKVNFVDVYNGLITLQESNSTKLQDVLNDDRHPNDLGYQYWFETIKTSFENNKLVIE